MKIPNDTITFRYYNANPKNRHTTDCVVRAICTALDQPYEQTVKELTELWLETGYDMSETKCFGKYLELSSTDLWHAFYNHQTAKEIGNMDLTFDELVYALDNINDAEVEKIVKRENGKLTLELSLEIDGGKIILIEVVSKSAGSICLKTCWKVNLEKYIQIYKK